MHISYSYYNQYSENMIYSIYYYYVSIYKVLIDML